VLPLPLLMLPLLMLPLLMLPLLLLPLPLLLLLLLPGSVVSCDDHDDGDDTEGMGGC
jgi:hypothetical protein